MIYPQIRPYYKNKISPDLITSTAEKVLQIMDQSGDVTIVITSSREVHQLNLAFRNMDCPTDVLSFPQGIEDPSTGEKYLGDVIISFQKASQQAESEGHPLEDEIRLLITHGILHLLGFDHHSLKERKLMWSHQRRILKQMNVNEDLFNYLESDR